MFQVQLGLCIKLDQRPKEDESAALHLPRKFSTSGTEVPVYITKQLVDPFGRKNDQTSSVVMIIR